MLTVLINAYAVSPNWGSEPGMGWNWIINLANFCKLDVITEGEWKDEIETALLELPQASNISFHYLPVSDKVRKMCWNQGDWRFYWYYRKWQKRALDLAKQIMAEKKIDVVHQLNMIGFREPGYLWKIPDVKYVWGPVGGMGDIPVAYLKGAGWKQNLFCRLKNFISNMQIRFSSRVHKAARRGTMIAATKEVQEKVARYYGLDIPLINETGCYPSSEANNATVEKHRGEGLRILWVGKFDFRKKLDLALEIMAKVKSPNVMLTVCGEGSETQVKHYKDLALKLGVSDKVIWKGRVANDEVKKLMRQSDLFLFTSIMEATSTVVLEAIEAGLPVLALNTCGFGPIVDDFAGKAIQLTDPEQSAGAFANAIDDIVNNPSQLSHLQSEIEDNKDKLSWNYKSLTISVIYQGGNSVPSN